MCSPLEQIEELHERLGGLKTLSDYARVSHRRDAWAALRTGRFDQGDGSSEGGGTPFQPLMRQRFHGPARNTLA